MSGETMNGRTIEIKVPLEEWVVDIATRAGKEGAKCVLVEHKANCWALKALPEMQKETAAAKLSWARIAGFTVGAGFIGGGVVAGIVRLLGLWKGG